MVPADTGRRSHRRGRGTARTLTRRNLPGGPAVTKDYRTPETYGSRGDGGNTACQAIWAAWVPRMYGGHSTQVGWTFDSGTTKPIRGASGERFRVQPSSERSLLSLRALCE